MNSATLAVVPHAATDEERAEALARRLSLPLLAAGTKPVDTPDFDILLIASGAHLSLQATGRKAPGPVAVDFGSGAMRHRRRGGQNELLGRACGIGKKEPLTVLDATAGLGRDAFVLADLGAKVTLVEQEALVAELLAAGLAEAGASEDPWLSAVAARMQLESRDSRQLSDLDAAGHDVIYLDPMFPATAKSASVKKDMAIFQRLFTPRDWEAEACALLDWALARSVARVVVKRPAKGELLGGHKPSHSLAGKAVRFDVYVLRAFTPAPEP